MRSRTTTQAAGRRERHADRGVSAPQGGGLSGLLRAHAAPCRVVTLRPGCSSIADWAFGSLIDFNVLDTRQYRNGTRRAVTGGATNCAAASGSGALHSWGWSRSSGSSSSLRPLSALDRLGQQVPMFARDNGPNAHPDTRFSMESGMATEASRQRVFARLLETRRQTRSRCRATCTCTMART